MCVAETGAADVLAGARNGAAATLCASFSALSRRLMRETDMAARATMIKIGRGGEESRGSPRRTEGRGRARALWKILMIHASSIEETSSPCWCLPLGSTRSSYLLCWLLHRKGVVVGIHSCLLISALSAAFDNLHNTTDEK